jgi:hypothetical protein
MASVAPALLAGVRGPRLADTATSLAGVAGWSRGRALVLAFLAVVALAVALGRPPGQSPRHPVEAGGGIYAADATIGPENATLRSAEEATPRRWAEGRTGRDPVAWVFAVLVAATVATAGWRWVRTGGGRSLPVTWPGLRALAPRAPPVPVPPR